VKITIGSLLLPSALLLANPEIPTTDPSLIDRVPKAKISKKESVKQETKPKLPAKPADERVSVHFIEKGDTLGRISERAYGRTRYWRILKLYNQCDPTKLKIGQEIKAPELDWLLASCGLQEKLPSVAAGMLKIHQDLIKVEDSTPDLEFSEEQLKEIDKLGTLAGEIQKALRVKETGIANPPYATLKQLRTCRKHLNKIASGKNARNQKTHSLAHEHLSNAIVYSVLWAKDGFK